MGKFYSLPRSQPITREFDQLVYNELVVPLNEQMQMLMNNQRIDINSVAKFISDNYPETRYKNRRGLGQYENLVKEAFVKYCLRQVSIPGFFRPDILSGVSRKSTKDKYRHFYCIDNAGNLLFFEFQVYGSDTVYISECLDNRAEIDDIFLYRGNPIGIEVGKIKNMRSQVLRKRQLLSMAYGEPSYIFRFSVGFSAPPVIAHGHTLFQLPGAQEIHDLSYEMFLKYNS